jgi:hypothetical protein
MSVFSNLSNQIPNFSDLTGPSLVSNNPESLGALQTNINSLNNNLKTIQGQSNATLSQQQSMNQIVSNETIRLNDKKQTVDNAYSSQQRAIYMNENIQKRYSAYTKIIIIWVIAAFVLFILNLIEPYMTFLPPLFFPLKYITIFSTVFIFSFIIYMDIQKHERLDYDRLYNKPLDASFSDISGYSDSSYNYSMAGCINEECCATGTVWDSSSGTCLAKRQGFENMYENTPYEYTDYAKYSSLV